jgi:hypothetical protein
VGSAREVSSSLLLPLPSYLICLPCLLLDVRCSRLLTVKPLDPSPSTFSLVILILCLFSERARLFWWSLGVDLVLVDAMRCTSVEPVARLGIIMRDS